MNLLIKYAVEHILPLELGFVESLSIEDYRSLNILNVDCRGKLCPITG